MKTAAIFILLIVIGGAGSYFYLGMGKEDAKTTDHKAEPSKHGATSEDECPEHKILEKDCPWCDKSIIASRGQCEHTIPKALCTQCNPKLIAGFKAEKDWCSGHNVPESQCKKCQGNDLPADEVKK